MKSQTKRSSSNRQEVDMDPYSTTILDELLENQQEWRSSDEIIKLTFKAMGDILKIHGQSIKDIKSVLTTRASKSQLTTGLSLKANVSDISQTIDQISLQIQDRLSYTDLNNILKEYIHRSQMAKALSQRHAEKQQTNQIQKSKQNSENLGYEIQILSARMNEFQKEVGKNISNCVTLNQFQEALNIIDAKANSKDLNQIVQNLVSKQFLSQCLQKKLNKSDLQSFLDSKADTQDLQYIVNSLQSKVNLATLQKLTQVIQNKADKSDLMMLMNERTSLNKSHQRSVIEDNSEKYENLKSQLILMISQLKQRVQNLNNSSEETLISKRLSLISTQFHQSLHLLKLQQSKNISDLRIESTQSIGSLRAQLKSLNQELLYRNNTKVDTFSRELTNEINLRKRCEEKIYEQIDEVRKKIDEITVKFFQRNEILTIKNQMNSIKSQLLNVLDKKIQKQQLNESIYQASVDISNKFEKSSETNKLILKQLQDRFAQAITTNTNDIIKFQKSLSKKQDKFQYSMIEETLRKSRKQVQDCRKTVDKIYEQLQAKLSISEYENDLVQIKKRFDKIFKEVEVKANIKDVCVLADSKPNIDDVNNALKQINQALNEKIAQTQLQTILKDQSSINQTLCSQNIIGRWMWQSGDLKAGGLVPWQVQSANTVPEHFFWQKDKTSILILAPGIYEIKACVFNKNSNLNVLINGQNIDVAKSDQNINTANNLRGKSFSQGKKKGKGKDITGNKVQHFVVLPARSRVSLCCLGDIGQGFLNVKRL